MIPAWLSRLGLGAGAAYLKRRLKGEGKEAAAEQLHVLQQAPPVNAVRKGVPDAQNE